MAKKAKKERLFTVRVMRNEPRHLWIEVAATNQEEAKAKALELAPNKDFFSGTTVGDATYEATEVMNS